MPTASHTGRLLPARCGVISEPAKRLIATVRDPSTSEADCMEAANPFLAMIGQAAPGEANEGLAILASALSVEDPHRAGFVALLCGSLVEIGHDPLPIAEPLRERLFSLLGLAGTLVESCRAKAPSRDDTDPQEVFEQIRMQLAPAMRLENAAWDALDRFWPAAIAVYSASPTARAAARTLRPLAAFISDLHEAGHGLDLMLSVLNDEPILVIEPARTLGVLARISGVVDNFQLNVLLMDAFPKSGIFARRRVSKQVAEIARGNGPQQIEDIVKGVWNLYNWEAIESQGRLLDPKDLKDKDFWIWNEGKPEDIHVFEGRRVILLGPPSYERTWGAQRMFDKLPATLECERNLTKAEVKDCLQRMLMAKSIERSHL